MNAMGVGAQRNEIDVKRGLFCEEKFTKDVDNLY